MGIRTLSGHGFSIGSGRAGSRRDSHCARSIPKINIMVRTWNRSVVAFYDALGYEDGAVVVLGRFLSSRGAS